MRNFEIEESEYEDKEAGEKVSYKSYHIGGEHHSHQIVVMGSATLAKRIVAFLNACETPWEYDESRNFEEETW